MRCIVLGQSHVVHFPAGSFFVNFMAQAARKPAHGQLVSMGEKSAGCDCNSATASLSKETIYRAKSTVDPQKIESHWWHGHFLCIEAFLIPKRESRA